jgi:cell shape-determining protein MreC
MISMNGLHGRVLAVDRNWNFVVLDLGNRNGVVANATMVVQRGASMVGKVRITTVEPSQSIADIVPNTVPAGINVEPGDSVIYPGF